MSLHLATGKANSRNRAVVLRHLWNFFDQAYCISLTTREDRRAAAREQFAAAGLGDKVSFQFVEKHPTDCEQGIYESHLACMAQGIAAGAEHMLIFEDDVVFRRLHPELLADAIRFMQRDQDWQVFFFGCLVKRSWKTDFPSILRIDYRSLAHAYAVPRRFAEEVVNKHPWRGVAFDAFLRDYRPARMFAVYPSVAFQSNAASDNDPYLPLDRIRRMLGGLQTIQRCNEFYQRYQWPIIGCHVLIIILIAAML